LAIILKRLLSGAQVGDILKVMIARQIKKDLGKALQKLKISSSKLALEHPVNPDHGDYSTNIAMRVKKKDLPSSFDLATKIVNTWRSGGLPGYLAKIEVVKPGFINLWLQNEYFISQIEEVIKKKDNFGRVSSGKGKTVVIDYSSPNIARPFGIGHFRSTIIGQALVNLYRFLGWEVIGINHLGDWGTQFGKLIYQIKNRHTKKKLTIKDLEKLYVEFHQRVVKKPKLEDEARKWFKKLEEGDPEAKKIWKECVEVSLKEFDRIYQRLNIKFNQTIGESFYQDKMKKVIESAKKKKILVKSEGAWVIKFPNLKIPPAILIKSDGATTYETRDLASIEYRRNKWHPDLFVYEVGTEQTLHFNQIFAAAVRLGYGKSEQLVHVNHGLFYLPGIGKLSTRTGKTIHLEKLLNESVKRAKKLGSQNQKVAEMVGVGAVKYFDLKNHPATNIAFDWQKMFALEGDSGPYLQYTHARCQSVLAKSEKDLRNEEFVFPYLHLKTEEQNLLRTLYKFPEVVQQAGEKFSPNLVCSFLFDLAQKYNVFYNKHSILKADNKELIRFRLFLTLAVSQIIKTGLNLLGIATPERM